MKRKEKEPDLMSNAVKCRICGKLSARIFPDTSYLCDECEADMRVEGYDYDLLK